MENKIATRVYHGNIKAIDIARDLKANFHRGNFVVQAFGKPENITLQIATNRMLHSGGQTALNLHLTDIADGVSISMSKQNWIGVAASLGFTALTAMRNPLALLHRIDDLAQDFESIQLMDEVWTAIEHKIRQVGAGYELSESLRTTTCEYCLTANPTGRSNCIACGAPLGTVQPTTCNHCGFVITSTGVAICPNCGNPV